MQYRPEVDGLRALAVVPVVLFHAQVPGFAGGFAGVDIFFVISGYLITSIIYAEMAAGTFSLAGFYERRVRRLLPALFVVLAATVAMTVAWLSPPAAKDFFKSLIAVPLFGSNFYFAGTTGYFSIAAELQPLLHTWSLAVEEQYYLFFPLFLLLAWRLARRGIVLLVALGLLLSLGFSIHYSVGAPGPAFFSTPARCWELLMGAMAALHLAERPARSPVDWSDQLLSLAGLALLVAVVTVRSQVLAPPVHTLLATVGASLVILFARPGTVACAVLSHKVLVGIGLVSYSLYLWHQPLMAMARIRAAGEQDHSLMPALAATVVLAYLTWRYVESPFRHRGRYPARRLVPAALACSLAFVGIGLAALQFDYTSLRFGAEKAAMSRRIWSTLEPKLTCTQGYAAVLARECILGAAQSGRTLAVVGDSHAGQWTDALDRFGRDSGIRVVMFAKAACATASVRYHHAALRREYWECSQWRINVLDKIRRGGFDAVLITNSSAGYAGQDQMVVRTAWKHGVKDFVQQVRPHTRQVFWLIDNPRYRANPFLCFEANFWHGGQRQCSVPRQDAIDEGLFALEREALADLPSVTVADFHDAYCDAERCAAFDGTVPIMRDTNHLTAHATLFLQPRLATLLKTAF